MGEKAWLRVRFIPMYERRATGEMIRVERDARAKDRHDQSVCSLSYALVRVRAVIFAVVRRH